MAQGGPPFRADHVGSLLRPAALKAARAEHAAGRLDAGALRAIEDRCIREAIARQEAIGLRAVTDGEYRRAFWHFDFLAGLDGIDLVETAAPVTFKTGAQLKPVNLVVSGKVGWRPHPFLADFAFVQANTRGLAKQTIPSPSVPHFRGGRAAIDARAYPDLGPFFADLGDAYAGAVRAFADAGCRYLQLDEVNIAYLCDPDQLAALRRRGDSTDGLLELYAGLINRAIAGRPAGMTVAMHLCRGNFRSGWLASGGYDPVAEVLFNSINVDAYFMEYDSERAGTFAPLRHVPKDKMVVLGLVTSKSGQLESRDDIRRRLDEAARIVPIEQLALSPQCGFASTEEGNLLDEDEQWRKLEFVVDIARDVWGHV